MSTESPKAAPEKRPFAKKSLGQNYLVDKTAVAKIVDSVPSDCELLLEIGPGRGAISTQLFSRAQKFCVLEKDDLFAKEIGETLFVHGSRHHHVFHTDALEFDWNRLWSETGSNPSAQLVVAANLPYNVATEILFRLLAMHERIPKMVLMFQKEVAQRIAAHASTKAYGSISVAAQNLYDIRVQQILKPGAFRPSPKVDSAVLEFVRLETPRVTFANKEEADRFRLFVRACFAHKRKTLENSLSLEIGKLPWKVPGGKSFVQKLLSDSGLDAKARAESISVEVFGEIFQKLITDSNL